MAITVKHLDQIETKAGLQYNRVVRIKYSDTEVAVASTGATITLTNDASARSLIKNFAHDLITAFDGGATSSLVIDVGYNGAAVDDVDAFIDNVELHADGTEIICAVGAGVSNVGGYMPVETTDIEAVLTATSANLSVLTQGEVELRWLEIPAAELRSMY